MKYHVIVKELYDNQQSGAQASHYFVEADDESVAVKALKNSLGVNTEGSPKRQFTVKEVEPLKSNLMDLGYIQIYSL